MATTKYDRANDGLNKELINPFVHHLELESTSEKIKTALLTVLLLPIRVVIICGLLVFAWCLTCVGLYGISEEELLSRPLTGWRRQIKSILCQIGTLTYAVGGMKIIIKGRQASRSEAPILVAAPHSTFLDGGIVYFTGLPSTIVRSEENGMNPYVQKLINYTQPVYVWREDPDSRQNAIKEIKSRVTSDSEWPQILIFPEGTCTNRQCLITFKPGAFYPGVPVQPVCIRYPNKLDTVTWTWEGPGALKLLWLTLTQMNSACEIEFLPVYHPNAEEKANPKLFAQNVRAVMARALDIPVSDFTYDDCRALSKAKQMNLKYANDVIDMQKFRAKLGLTNTRVEETLLNSTYNYVNFFEFCEILRISSADSASRSLFKLFDKGDKNQVDFREYLFTTIVLAKDGVLDVLEAAFKIFDSSGTGKLSKADFIEAVTRATCLFDEEIIEVFYLIADPVTLTVTYENLVNLMKHKMEYADLLRLTDADKCQLQNNNVVDFEKKRG